MLNENYVPKWHRELEIFTQIKPLIILDGNILDIYQYPINGTVPKGSIIRLPDYLHFFFMDVGYQNIVFYDSEEGFSNVCDPKMIESFSKEIHANNRNGVIQAPFRGSQDDAAPRIIRRALEQNQISRVIILNMASRYISSPDNLAQNEVDAYTPLIKASVLVKGDNFQSFFDREVFSADMSEYSDKSDELEKIQDKFIALTDGMSFTELNGLRKLCKKEKLHIREMCDVIDLFKYGIRENPWRQLDLDTIRNAPSKFEKRVKGQPYAQTKTLDIIKRAITGLSGLQGSSHGRPKGVLFFAGPTGTGKTETAKTLAEILFGSEETCIRFDMSEYSQSHSDQKLLGAPPGYVGYEAGGQLTNAIKAKPFSILLFDEIEKAHPTILDKFLQILEDGRMNAQGERVQNVSSDMAYEEVSSRVRSAIESYFKLELGRPEILNRIGENIVVFDYIREPIAKQILDAQIYKIKRTLLMEKNIKLELTDSAQATLLNAAVSNLNNGGNIVESHLINPLARFLFDNNVFKDAEVIIRDIDTAVSPVSLIGESKALPLNS